MRQARKSSIPLVRAIPPLKLRARSLLGASFGMPNHIVHGVGDTQDAKNEPTASNVCLARIEEAAQRISAYVNSTPVLTCETLNELSGGRSVFFKCELFQKTGSFKARGACNAVLLAPEDCTDFVTHSSGNHAQVSSIFLINMMSGTSSRLFCSPIALPCVT